MDRGVPIRSISRSIQVLQAINRAGSLSMTGIARAANLPYPTTCRIVQTLVHEQLIELEPARKHYRPTQLVRTLSLGFQEDGRLVASARDAIVNLTRKVGWPVTVTTQVGQAMMVRDSTHSLTTLTFNHYYPGYTLPIFECASGLAYLAFASPDERDQIVASADTMDPRPQAFLIGAVRDGTMLRQIRTDGYATKGRNRFTANPGKTSSIAMPVHDRTRLVGVLALVFFSSSMDMNEAVENLVPELRATVAEVEDRLASMTLENGAISDAKTG